ncbi:MAG: toxin-antitoxin system antitoxin subunit [Egibacteraceae bacterium]
MTVKLTISVPDDVAHEARDAVRAGRAASVSGYFVTAVQHYRQAMTLEEWLAQADADAGGPPSAETSARVDAQLGLPASLPSASA